MSDYWQGECVQLRTVWPNDWERHYLMDGNGDLSRSLDRVYFPQSPARVQNWAREAGEKGEDGSDTFQFEIASRETGESVGGMGTHHCDKRVGSFAYGLAIAPEFQRRGFGQEAISLVLRYYFHELRYQKATVQIFAFNAPSVYLHEKLGFTLEGRMRRMAYTNGQHHDVLVYGLLAEEFRL